MEKEIIILNKPVKILFTKTESTVYKGLHRVGI